MHELSIISSIFDLLEEVAEEHHLITITKVKLKIGKLQQIVPDMLSFAFETIAKGTRAEGACLEVREIPISMRCETCSTEFVVEEQVYICPNCSGTRLTPLQGMEILLESVEGEQS